MSISSTPFPGLMILIKNLAKARYGLTLDELLRNDDKLIEILKSVAGDSWDLVYKHLKGMDPPDVREDGGSIGEVEIENGGLVRRPFRDRGQSNTYDYMRRGT